ncbi:MAG: ATP-binding cassette domain-containing protein [Muribaculaceae bacterium]|nr:ATP-binding cassette domain-containing protein [Muribaculaceae bacterium]
MEKITINNLLPEVFSEEKDSQRIKNSDIWMRHLSFDKPLSYLVFAESGTGKSSLCSYLYGNRRDYEGTILFDGNDVRGYSADKWSQLRRMAIAYLPQQLSLFPELTAIDNVLLKNRLTDYYSEADIRRMFEQLSVDNRADVAAGRLSIGQQQRVAIVRALAQPFDFLLLDEPVSHLDARNNDTVAQMITSHAESRHAAVIATSVGNHLSIDSYKILRL